MKALIKAENRMTGQTIKTASDAKEQVYTLIQNEGLRKIGMYLCSTCNKIVSVDFHVCYNPVTSLAFSR